ncbi:replication protein A 70 kDa DNA-binding subunit C-like protein [Tanacetum coccineum]
MTAFTDKETSEGVDEQIVRNLIQMLDQYNSVSKAFRMARDWCNTHNLVNFHLRLHSEQKTTRQYNAPTVSEVAALIINDFGDGLPTRDVIDAMALCRAYDNLDLFITFTSNPKWPEISEMLAYFPGQKSHDGPEIGTLVYVIEFQKRGLPHAHILLWLEEHCKCKTSSEIDDIILAELPSLTDDLDGYKAVTHYMLHGPCGKDSRNATCTSDWKCSKHFPKPFLAETFLDEEGYPHYRRRDNKNAITLRNSERLLALLEREGIDVTMFTDWFELNKRDPAARTLTYAEIPKHYV